MMNLNLKKLFATLGIATLTLAANVATTPFGSLAVSEYTVTATDEIIDGKGFTINAVDDQTFVNYADLGIQSKDGYWYIATVDGTTPQWYGTNNKKNNYNNIAANNLTKTTTVKIKCVKDSSSDKTLAKRFAKAKVYTYKFNVINTGVSVDTIDADTVADGMDVYADSADIKLGYPGKAITYGEYDSLGFYKAKGKVFDDMDRKTVKTSTKKYDKKYAKLAAQTLYYTLDGSTPTTKSAKVSAGKLKTITVETPGTHTLKVMGAKEKKVYTYTFYVDTVTATTVDVPEANVYACSDDGLRSFYVTPQNVSVTAYKYFKTYFGVDVYKDATKGSTHEKIAVEAGTTMEIPYNYFEGKGIRYTGHSTFDN